MDVAASDVFGAMRAMTRMTSNARNSMASSMSSSTAAPLDSMWPVSNRYGMNSSTAGSTPKYEYQWPL